MTSPDWSMLSVLVLSWILWSEFFLCFHTVYIFMLVQWTNAVYMFFLVCHLFIVCCFWMSPSSGDPLLILDLPSYFSSSWLLLCVQSLLLKFCSFCSCHHLFHSPPWFHAYTVCCLLTLLLQLILLVEKKRICKYQHLHLFGVSIY